ncbi:MAG: mechanosensitive ion channel family protein [Kiritimatiellia bacterium]
MTGASLLLYVVSVVLAGIAVFGAMAYIMHKQESLQSAGQQHVFWHALRELMVVPGGLLIFLFSLAALLPGLGLAGEAGGNLSHGVRVAILAATAWVLIRSLAVGRQLILIRHDIHASDNLEARRIYTQIRVIERLLAVAIVVIVLALILMSFERMRQVGVSLIASAGVIGVIIGFAAQRTIATVLAGLQIALTQPIRLDDVVIVEGEWGWIEEITLTYVVVKVWDLRRLIVPIQYFIEQPFQNWTRTSADILGTVFLHTDYRVPVEEVRAKLHEILESSPLWDRKAWCLQVTEARPATLELRALMSSRNSPEAWDLRCLVREKLLGWLQETYPQYLPQTRVSLTADQGDDGNLEGGSTRGGNGPVA